MFSELGQRNLLVILARTEPAKWDFYIGDQKSLESMYHSVLAEIELTIEARQEARYVAGFIRQV